MNDTQRFVRQSQLIAPAMQDATVLVVGAGMLGSWAINSLVRTCKHVVAVDYDTVGAENIGTQGFNPGDIGLPKVVALKAHLFGLPFTAIADRFRGNEDRTAFGLTLSLLGDGPLVVVSAVDSFSGRRLVCKWAVDNDADLFIDLRAHGTVGVVCAVPLADELVPAYYLSTLENDVDAPEAACGMEGTAYVGMWCATQATAAINGHFRGMAPPFKLVYDAQNRMTLTEQYTRDFIEEGSVIA